MTARNADDYLLGTHDEEIERLALQHRVWRPRVMDAWRRAGIRSGEVVLDIGAGPGFAAIDLAGLVGPAGRVVALERSMRFLAALEAEARLRGLSQISAHAIDLDSDEWPDVSANHAWCRWVLAFVTQPQQVLERIAARLRPGGAIIAFEYGDYASWRLMPQTGPFALFVDTVIRAWREDGGEPGIGLALPAALALAGFDVVSVRPIVDVVSPADALWKWPAAFVRVGVERLAAIGRLDPGQARVILDDFAARSAQSSARMLTPLVLEVIAIKR